MSIFNDLFSLIALSKQSGIKVREGGGEKWVGCCVGGVVLRDNLVLSTELTTSVSLLIELIENRRSPSFHHSDERLTLETLALETL